jgi:hypothetical protein
MAEKKSHPLMHPIQLTWLKAFIRTEIEFAFSVENGGRYGRRDLRRRMRQVEKTLDEVLTEVPMANFGIDSSEDSNEEAHFEEQVNAGAQPDESLFGDTDDDDEEDEHHVEGAVLSTS